MFSAFSRFVACRRILGFFFLLSWFLLESDGIEWLSLLEMDLVWIKDRIRVLSIYSYFDWFVVSVVTDLSDVVA